MTSFDQAVLALVWQRAGGTCAQIGTHFGVSTGAAWRYCTEAMNVLAAYAPTLQQALREAGAARQLVLDGTLVRITRCALAPADYDGGNQDQYYAGRHHRHGVNTPGLVGMDGEPVFVGQARCSSTRDLVVARRDRIIQAAHAAGSRSWPTAGTGARAAPCALR